MPLVKAGMGTRTIFGTRGAARSVPRQIVKTFFKKRCLDPILPVWIFFAILVNFSQFLSFFSHFRANNKINIEFIHFKLVIYKFFINFTQIKNFYTRIF